MKDLFKQLTEYKRRRHASEELEDYLEENPLATYDDAYSHLMFEGYELSNIEYVLNEANVGNIEIQSDSWEELLTQLSDMGYIFNDRYYDKPVQWIDSTKNNNIYEIEIEEEDDLYKVKSIGLVHMDKPEENTLHDKLAQFMFDTSDYYELADNLEDDFSGEGESTRIMNTIWDLSDAQLVEYIEDSLDTCPEDFISCEFMDEDTDTANQKTLQKAQALINEYYESIE